ncbi:UNVERIFIED_CONTAM: hypothetical protein GTU68_006398, partial [Idotea baltica]|nr:hypothetical protein [Idotea baltica]
MVSNNKISDNLMCARRQLEIAANAGACIAVLPETFSCMGNYDRQSFLQRESMGHGIIVNWLKKTAQELNLWIVAGSLPLFRSNDFTIKKPYSSCLVINNQGQQVARYDKIHLFDANISDKKSNYQESLDYSAGSCAVLVDTPVGRLGLIICYDIRFPELYLNLRQGGADIISIPAAFTQTTGVAHWE